MKFLQLVNSDYSEYETLQEFYNTLPKKPSCANDKGYSLIRSKNRASKFKFIQANHLVVNYLIIDIDSPLKETATEPYFDQNLLFRFHDRNLPTPQIIIRNPKNGHVQYFYKLKNPVYLFGGARRKPINYLNLIKDTLTGELGGDPNFTHHLAKNPLATDCEVFLTGAEPLELDELADNLPTDKYAKKPEQKLNKVINENVFSRNCDMFDYLRHIAYKIADSMSERALNDELIQLSRSHNKSFAIALRDTEIRCIVRSIVKYCKSERFNSTKADREKRKLFAIENAHKANQVGACSKGGQARSDSYRKQRERAIELFNNGMKKAQIAKELKVSRPTIYAWLK